MQQSERETPLLLANGRSSPLTKARQAKLTALRGLRQPKGGSCERIVEVHPELRYTLAVVRRAVADRDGEACEGRTPQDTNAGSFAARHGHRALSKRGLEHRVCLRVEMGMRKDSLERMRSWAGKLVARSWQDNDGNKPQSVEIQVTHVGADLHFASAEVDRFHRRRFGFGLGPSFGYVLGRPEAKHLRAVSAGFHLDPGSRAENVKDPLPAGASFWGDVLASFVAGRYATRDEVGGGGPVVMGCASA